MLCERPIGMASSVSLGRLTTGQRSNAVIFISAVTAAAILTLAALWSLSGRPNWSATVSHSAGRSNSCCHS